MHALDMHNVCAFETNGIVDIDVNQMHFTDDQNKNMKYIKSRRFPITNYRYNGKTVR